MPKKLHFQKFDPAGIPLPELIAVHRMFSPKRSLPLNIGDGYLCLWNPVFRNLRAAAVERGFRFQAGGHPRYYAFPLMSLDEVIEARVIPYRDNFSWISALEQAAPRKFTLTELKRSELQFNYLFHESAHCVAHAELFGRARFARLPKTFATLLGVLLGEAFANTVECLSFAFTEGEIGAYFLDANCHFRANKKEVREIRAAAEKWGYEACARVLLASFLYANYLHERITPAQRARIAKFAGLGRKDNIRELAKIGTELSAQFRTTTTHLHLVKMGFPARLEPLMKGDPMRALMKNHKMRAGAERLAALAVQGL